MPKRRRSIKKSTFKRRRRTYGRNRKKYRGRVTRLYRGPVNPLAIAKLNYQTHINLAPGAGLTLPHLFRTVSLYDPDYTGTGHQPMGFDQLMAQYNHFTVVGAKITCTFTRVAETDAVVGIHVNAGTTTGYGSQEVCERRHTLFRLMSGNLNNSTTLSMKFSTKKFFGKKNVVSAAEFKGTNIAGPSENAYWHVFCGSPDGSNQPSVKVFIRIQYVAAFTEPKGQSQS